MSCSEEYRPGAAAMRVLFWAFIMDCSWFALITYLYILTHFITVHHFPVLKIFMLVHQPLGICFYLQNLESKSNFLVANNTSYLWRICRNFSEINFSFCCTINIRECSPKLKFYKSIYTLKLIKCFHIQTNYYVFILIFCWLFNCINIIINETSMSEIYKSTSLLPNIEQIYFQPFHSF